MNNIFEQTYDARYPSPREIAASYYDKPPLDPEKAAELAAVFGGGEEEDLDPGPTADEERAAELGRMYSDDQEPSWWDKNIGQYLPWYSAPARDPDDLGESKNMKIKKIQLEKIIREELEAVLSEQEPAEEATPPAGGGGRPEPENKTPEYKKKLAVYKSMKKTYNVLKARSKKIAEIYYKEGPQSKDHFGLQNKIKRIRAKAKKAGKKLLPHEELVHALRAGKIPEEDWAGLRKSIKKQKLGNIKKAEAAMKKRKSIASKQLLKDNPKLAQWEKDQQAAKAQALEKGVLGEPDPTARTTAPAFDDPAKPAVTKPAKPAPAVTKPAKPAAAATPAPAPATKPAKPAAATAPATAPTDLPVDKPMQSQGQGDQGAGVAPAPTRQTLPTDKPKPKPVAPQAWSASGVDQAALQAAEKRWNDALRAARPHRDVAKQLGGNIYSIPRNQREAAAKGLPWNAEVQAAAAARREMAAASRALRKAKGQKPRKFKGGKQV